MMMNIQLRQSGEVNINSSHDHLMSFYYSVIYIGPSVTPYQHNNPAYRIYEMDGLHNDTSFQLVNDRVNFFNLTTANSKIMQPGSICMELR